MFDDYDSVLMELSTDLDIGYENMVVREDAQADAMGMRALQVNPGATPGPINRQPTPIVNPAQAPKPTPAPARQAPAAAAPKPNFSANTSTVSKPTIGNQNVVKSGGHVGGTAPNSGTTPQRTAPTPAPSTTSTAPANNPAPQQNRPAPTPPPKISRPQEKSTQTLQDESKARMGRINDIINQMRSQREARANSPVGKQVQAAQAHYNTLTNQGTQNVQYGSKPSTVWRNTGDVNAAKAAGTAQRHELFNTNPHQGINTGTAPSTGTTAPATSSGTDTSTAPPTRGGAMPKTR